MRARVWRDREHAAADAAGEIARVLADHARPVLALPTGQTAVPLYAALVERHRAGGADFAEATTFNLDEFIGLPPTDPRSYHGFMRRHLFDHVNLARARRHLFRGTAPDHARELIRVERLIARAGGFDLAVLGLGSNGHLALNEPGTSLVARSHVARLRPETRRANAADFGGRWQDVPTHAFTMGMATMLQARAVVLLALGSHKAAVLARALTGPVTPACPASLLALHPNLIVICDRPAAAQLPRSLRRAAGRTATS